jgi:hypothetical protein
MVKLFFTVLILCTYTFGDALLENKISSFIGEKKYQENKDYIDIVFSPRSQFYVNNRLDDVRVIKTLKDNGLLDLFFDKPQELKLTFKTNGSPVFFLKIMTDSLRDIGYFRYIATESKRNLSEFIWSISLTSEYATDPLILQQELLKRGCNIIDIEMHSSNEWKYGIDMSNAHLDTLSIMPDESIELKRSLYAQWVNIENSKELKFQSSFRNNWYPYITFYDKSLHLVKVVKLDTKKRVLKLQTPSQAVYVKISDLYTLKNVRDPLQLTSIGTK